MYHNGSCTHQRHAHSVQVYLMHVLNECTQSVNTSDVISCSMREIVTVPIKPVTTTSVYHLTLNYSYINCVIIVIIKAHTCTQLYIPSVTKPVRSDTPFFSTTKDFSSGESPEVSRRKWSEAIYRSSGFAVSLMINVKGNEHDCEIGGLCSN